MPSTSPRRRDAGFTLIETLLVVAIIGIMAAIGLPQIMNYMRHFRIRGATSDLATALQTSRMRAISKSAQHGVVLATQNNTTYWIHVEDDQTLPRVGAAQPLNLAVQDTAQSTRFQLPPDVVFATAAQCTPTPPLGLPYAAYAPTTQAVRFNRMGASCIPGTSATTCPALGVAGGVLTNFVQNGGTYVMFCLRDTRNGLSRWVAVSRGGRVQAQR